MCPMPVPVTGRRIFNRISLLCENARHNDFIAGKIQISQRESFRHFVSFVIEHDMCIIDARVDDADFYPFSAISFNTIDL